MKIISKFKDYYDVGASYGIDTTRIFIREEKIIENVDFKISEFNVIGFCGKLYPYISVAEKRFESNEWLFDPKYYTLYGEDSINFRFQGFNKKTGELCDFKRAPIKEGFDYKIVPYEKKIKFYYRYNFFTHKELYEELIKNKKINNLFIDYKTPIFNITKNSKNNTILIICPCLKDVAFFKIKDPVTAFQEIEQFISNQLVSDTQVIVPVGNDKVIAESKGFDKYSFRKDKQIKK